MQLSEKEIKRLKRKYGEWAVVTGASSGIGLEITRQLAFCGINLVIVARNYEKLKEVEAAILAKNSVAVIVIAADVSQAGGIDEVIKATKHLNIGLLVNAAGFGSSGLFLDTSIHAETNMLRTNCESVLQLTHYFAQKFKQQKRGGIILFSSIVAFQGVAYSANYAATKAYIQSLAEALSIELAPFGIDVLSAAPGPVFSGFAKRANMKMGMAQTPEKVGVPILKALGKKKTVFPGSLTKFLVYSLALLPRWGKILVMKQIMYGMSH